MAIRLAQFINTLATKQRKPFPKRHLQHLPKDQHARVGSGGLPVSPSEATNPCLSIKGNTHRKRASTDVRATRLISNSVDLKNHFSALIAVSRAKTEEPKVLPPNTIRCYPTRFTLSIHIIL